jgi:tetratricopeptide (TPR) repeat protein
LPISSAPPGAFEALTLACDAAEADRLLEALGAIARATSLAPSHATVRLAAAQLRFHVGDVAGARDELDAAAALGPHAAALARDLRIRCYERVGHWLEALALLEQACREQPSPARHGYAADLYLRRAEAAPALEHATRAAQLAPRTPDWALMRARALAALGRVDEAAQAAAFAVSLGPDNLALGADAAHLLLDEGHPDAAQALAPPVNRLLGARIAVARGDAAEASALVAGLDDTEARALRGAAELLSGRASAAVPLLEAAASLRPGDVDLGLRLAEALMREGRFQDAVAHAERSRLRVGPHFSGYLVRWLVRIAAGLENDPLDTSARDELGAGMERVLPGSSAALSSTRDEAFAAMGRVLSMMGGSRSAAVTRFEHGRTVPLGRITDPRAAARAAQARFPVMGEAAALATLQAVIDRYPASAPACCYRGELHLWRGDFASARADFERALAIDRRTRWGYVGLLATETFEGHLVEAEEIIAKGIAISGIEGRNSIYAYRGELRLRQGQLDEAKALLEAGLELTPTRVSSWALLALTHDRREDEAAAARSFARFCREAPTVASDAAREAGITAERLVGPPDREVRHAVVTGALEAMRGNRSSSCPTYFVRGQLRAVVPPRVRSVRELRDRLLRLARGGQLGPPASRT